MTHELQAFTFNGADANPFDGFVLENGQPQVSSQHVAKLADWLHWMVIRKIRDLVVRTKKINDNKNVVVHFSPVESTYIDEKGEKRTEYLMTPDEAILLQSTFSGERGITTVAILQKEVRVLRDIIRGQDKRLVEFAKRYHLTDCDTCSSISAICSRFELTPQKAYKALVREGVLKKIRNGKRIIYRPKAKYLGHGYFNIDQHCDDLTTHLKFTDDEGIRFLTEWFTKLIAKEKADREFSDLKQRPLIPGMEDWWRYAGGEAS